MKLIITLAITFYLSTPLLAREVHCVVSDVHAPYSDIEMEKGKGNKYNMKVYSESELLLEQTVAYTFSRRARVGTFRSKNNEIKSLGLVLNKGVRSQFKLHEISKLTYTGLCKLYKK